MAYVTRLVMDLFIWATMQQDQIQDWQLREGVSS